MSVITQAVALDSECYVKVALHDKDERPIDHFILVLLQLDLLNGTRLSTVFTTTLLAFAISCMKMAQKIRISGLDILVQKCSSQQF